jgi:hypothetical protein
LIGHHFLHTFRSHQCFSREYHPARGASSSSLILFASSGYNRAITASEIEAKRWRKPR